MGKFDFYVTKNDELVSEHLRKLPDGELSMFVVTCIKRNLIPVIEGEIKNLEQKIAELNVIKQAAVNREPEIETSRKEDYEWFEILVDTFAKNLDRTIAHARHWANSPDSKSDLKVHGFSPNDFVKAVEERRRRK